MPARLCILACHNFQREVAAAIAAENWPDVVALAFPSRCGRPPLGWEEIRELLPGDCSQVVVLGSACLAGLGDAPAGYPPTRLLPQEQCFHLVAPPSLVAEAMTAGGYLITPGWLANWRDRLAELGFEIPPARENLPSHPPGEARATQSSAEFFQDFARELVLFDTGVDAETRTHLAELSDAVGLPLRRIDVGLDHTRLLLVRVVFEWRLEAERQAARARQIRHAGELADHVAAMDMLVRLAKTRQEGEAIAVIEELFRMLFAPAIWHYLRLEHGQPVPEAALPAAVLDSLLKLAAPWSWTPSGQGFMLRIARDGEVLGLLLVEQLAFPEYRERYLNLALAVTGVCALAIDNARTRKRLVEAEKMAALGIMVAGVAHEINTPIGVGLTAASTLRDKTLRLEQRFAERSMTQSDLQGYFAVALAETNLIHGNLDRIGQLVEAFRQVAVAGRSPAKSRFRLKSCLDDVLASLGPRLPAERVTVSIQCQDDLEIESFPGDWASIFTNLITNSLQHGFKGRDHGRIAITVTTADGRLRVVFADDGVGLTTEVQARIFDPFYTTDLQHGMGLGMHLVYNLVTQRLGGSIVCDSRPGLGARFYIETPL